MKRPSCSFMFFLLVTSCFCVLVSSCGVSFFPAERFHAARSQWETNGIRDYEAVVQVNLPLSTSWQYRSVIHNGNIIETSRRMGNLGLGIPLENQGGFAPESFNSINLDELEPYTIEGLIRLANDSIGSTYLLEIRPCASGLPYYDIDYNAQYGYINSMHITCGGGFLGCPIGDCNGGYTVLSFTPISP